MAEPRPERQERHEICRNCDRPSTAAWYRGESRSECSSKSPAPPRKNGAPRSPGAVSASRPRRPGQYGERRRGGSGSTRRTRCAGRRECAGPARKRRGAEFGRGTCTCRLDLGPFRDPGGGRRRRNRRPDSRGHGPGGEALGQGEAGGGGQLVVALQGEAAGDELEVVVLSPVVVGDAPGPGGQEGGIGGQWAASPDSKSSARLLMQ
jgi:hypothetical protein